MKDESRVVFVGEKKWMKLNKKKKDFGKKDEQAGKWTDEIGGWSNKFEQGKTGHYWK